LFANPFGPCIPKDSQRLSVLQEHFIDLESPLSLFKFSILPLTNLIIKEPINLVLNVARFELCLKLESFIHYSSLID